jgi:hypothetical protein
MEGKRSNEHAAELVQIYEQRHGAPLAAFEGSWMNLHSDAAAYAYAWALANVEYLVQANGMVDLQRILDHIAAGSSTEAAIYEVLHINYDEVIQGTAAYLRKTYL